MKTCSHCSRLNAHYSFVHCSHFGRDKDFAHFEYLIWCRKRSSITSSCTFAFQLLSMNEYRLEIDTWGSRVVSHGNLNSSEAPWSAWATVYQPLCLYHLSWSPITLRQLFQLKGLRWGDDFDRNSTALHFSHSISIKSQRTEDTMALSYNAAPIRSRALSRYQFIEMSLFR